MVFASLILMLAHVAFMCLSFFLAVLLPVRFVIFAELVKGLFCDAGRLRGTAPAGFF